MKPAPASGQAEKTGSDIRTIQLSDNFLCFEE